MDDPLSLELPPDLTARPATAEDIPAIVELIAACELEEDGVTEVDEDDVSFERHGLDPELDTMLVFDRDELVAWAELYRRRAEADVRPSHRGRGIGSTVLGWSEGRGRELGDPEVNQTKTDANDGARDLFLANGYQPRWVSWMIRMALSDTPPPPELPAGISIRPYRATDARDVHRVIDDAFTEWPGRDPEPYEVWASMIAAHRAFRPELSPLAFGGDELVGVVIVDDYPDAGEGWILPARDEGHPPAPRDRAGAAPYRLRMVPRTRPNARRRLDRLADDGRPRAVREGRDARRSPVHPLHQTARLKRRPRDSNPRGGCPPTRSPGVPLRPLGQASAAESSGGVTPNGRPFRGGTGVRGGDRIRTCEGRVRPLTAFEAVPFVRSGTPPGRV